MIDGFVRAHRLDHPRVAAAVAPWRIERIAASTVRTAVDLVLVGPDRPRVLVCVEPRVDGAEHLAATSTLHLSYYAEDGVDHAAAAAVVRALAAALRELEGDGAAARRALPVLEGAGRAFVEVRVNRACNERCRFCNTPEDSPAIAPGPDAVLAQIAAAGRAGCRDLLITGRETTLDPRLPDYLEAARAAGIATRRVQTNGTTLGHRPLLDRLVAAGLTAVEVSLHTLDPDVFDELIGNRGLLAHACAGLDALAAVPVAVTVVTVLTARNADAVPALVATIAARWPHVRTLVLSPVAPVGDGADALDLLVPYARLGPIVADALRIAAAHGIAASVPARCGLPPCTLPPDVRDRHDAIRADRGAPLEPGKHKPPACAGCALDRVCGGAWTRYLDRHGADALAPI